MNLTIIMRVINISPVIIVGEVNNNFVCTVSNISPVIIVGKFNNNNSHN